MSGNSQAVRLPKDFQFDVKEVEILKRGDEVVLRKKHKNMSILFDI
ncbi:MAG: antitoxin, partial [Burkholderiaceae bacterium]